MLRFVAFRYTQGMIKETMSLPTEDSEGEGQTVPGQERRKIGELPDSYEGPGGPEFYGAEDVDAFLNRLKAFRNPDEEVQVPEARETVEAQLRQVDDLYEKEKERDEALERTRQSLGTPHEKGSKLKELEDAKKKLEDDKEYIELASTYNHTLEEFGDTTKFSSDDIAHVMETGKRKDGTHLKDKHGNKIESHVAKKLAHHYKTGGRRMTWGNAMDLREICEVADRVIGDITGAVKGVLGMEKGERSFAE